MSDKRYPTRMHEVLGVETKEDHIIRLERMRSQKDRWANGKHAHWLETPADHAKDRDALDAAIEALTGKPRLTEEQVAHLKAAQLLVNARWLAKDADGGISLFRRKPVRDSDILAWIEEDRDYWWFLPDDTPLKNLVSWSDPEPLDIVQTLRDAGELEEDWREGNEN